MWDEALQRWREAFRLAPASAPYSRSAMDFYSRGKIGEAIALSRAAVRDSPTDAAARYNLGYYLLDSGEPDTALLEFREPCGSNRTTPSTWRVSD